MKNFRLNALIAIHPWNGFGIEKFDRESRNLGLGF